MIVLPPIPTRDDEKQDFLLEVAHIINNGSDRVSARSSGKRDDIPVNSCYLRYNDRYDEMEFVIYAVGNLDEPVWRARLSSIGFAAFGSGFWLELEAASQPSVVLFEPSE